MDAVTHPSNPVLQTTYHRELAAWWNNRPDADDRANRVLGDIDGLHHHHYGLGDYDQRLLELSGQARDEAVIAELHRLESAQADYLIDHLGDLGPDDRVLDGGCGRGGTSFMAHQRFGCRIDGVTIAQTQVDFAHKQAVDRGCVDTVRFHFLNMLDTGFPDGAFTAVFTNETTMYVDLDELFAEFARLLKPGGRYAFITGAHNDTWGAEVSPAVARINARYLCSVHPRSRYVAALARHGLVPITVENLTPRTLPYWELRAQSPVRSGVEDDFLEAYREGSFHYLLMVADRP